MAFTVGANARIGANSVVLKEVPPCATVIGIPGRVVKTGRLQDGKCFDAYGTPVKDFDDATAALETELKRDFDLLKAQITELEARIEKLNHTREDEDA